MCFLNLCTSSNLKINLSSLISETIIAGNGIISEDKWGDNKNTSLQQNRMDDSYLYWIKMPIYLSWNGILYRQITYRSTTYLQPSKLTFVPSLLLYTVHSPSDVGLRYSSMYSLRYSCPFPLPYLPYNMKEKMMHIKSRSWYLILCIYVVMGDKATNYNKPISFLEHFIFYAYKKCGNTYYYTAAYIILSSLCKR